MTTKKQQDQCFDLVLKGWLVTLKNGSEFRLAPSRERAEKYAKTQQGTLEPMFVKRPNNEANRSG